MTYTFRQLLMVTAVKQVTDRRLNWSDKEYNKYIIVVTQSIKIGILYSIFTIRFLVISMYTFTYEENN